MKINKKRSIGCIAILLVIFISGCGSANTASKEALKKAEGFAMKNLQDQAVTLADFKGKNVYVKYWASWCPICLDGLKEMNELSKEDPDFVVLTIVAPNYKSEKNMEDFKTWFQGVKNTKYIQVLFDEDGEYMKKIGIRGFPSSQWIDESGNIIQSTTGHVDNEVIKAGFE